MDQEPIIVTCELRKVYGEISVIDGLNLEVPRGSICGLLGRNRAAKTTLLKMFVGLTRPTSVEGRIFGLRIDRSAESSLRVRRQNVSGCDYGCRDNPLHPRILSEVAV
ncbi:MAG: hypothetical protein DMG57_27975 [Acidobacteria bacterium]|nr:MAG: hypothetical protein DMG57_27975 [Acidobacteriota bacterium]